MHVALSFAILHFITDVNRIFSQRLQEKKMVYNAYITIL